MKKSIDKCLGALLVTGALVLSSGAQTPSLTSTNATPAVKDVAASEGTTTNITATSTAPAESTTTSEPVMVPSDSDWKFGVELYFWGAGIGGDSASGKPVKVSFDDLFSDLNVAFMATFEAKKEKWLILADVLYLDLSDKENVPVSDGTTTTTLPVDIDMQGFVFQLAGGYNLLSINRWHADVVLGARYFSLDSDITVDMGGSITKVSESGSVIDAIIGLKGYVTLGKRWAVPYYLDIGTGESDFTWQGMTGISFKAASWCDIQLVYRYLSWNVNGSNLDNINFKGPALGAVFHW